MIRDLPWGWIYQNRAFCEPIKNDYSILLDKWLAAKKETLREEYEALKALIIFLVDIERICKEKGECFVFWYYNILSTRDYLKWRKKDLKELEKELKIK